jgi:predicted restriction endonuclease
MSDMPSLNESEIKKFKQKIKKIKLGRKDGNLKPHKLIMLLAVIDMAEAGFLTENKIYYTEPLLGFFNKNFRKYSSQKDWCQPAPPFFHLRSSGFWFHKPIAGREAVYNSLNSSGGGSKRIIENIEYSYLDENTFIILSNKNARLEIKQLIITIIEEIQAI